MDTVKARKPGMGLSPLDPRPLNCSISLPALYSGTKMAQLAMEIYCASSGTILDKSNKRSHLSTVLDLCCTDELLTTLVPDTCLEVSSHLCLSVFPSSARGFYFYEENLTTNHWWRTQSIYVKKMYSVLDADGVHQAIEKHSFLIIYCTGRLAQENTSIIN